MRRGEIYYIESSYNSTGSEQRAGRPAIIVSNNNNNDCSATVEVVYLTTQPKKDLPTHVMIRGTGRDSIALCEQVDTVAIERVGSYCGQCSKTEMSNIDIALMVSLDLTLGAPKEKIVEAVKEVPVVKEVPAPDTNVGHTDELERKLVATEAQLTIVQAMYAELLKQLTLK